MRCFGSALLAIVTGTEEACSRLLEKTLPTQSLALSPNTAASILEKLFCRQRAWHALWETTP